MGLKRILNGHNSCWFVFSYLRNRVCAVSWTPQVWNNILFSHVKWKQENSWVIVMLCWYAWSLTSVVFSIQFLDQNYIPRMNLGNVEQCSWYLNVSHWVSEVGILTKESQIQNSGTSVSAYNDVVCRWLWKPLAARWEFQFNGGHIEIPFC